MLMIVAHHFACHGGFSFSVDSVSLNRFWHVFIFMGGALGNDIFVMLSGYFLINSKGLNFRRLFNLWTRMFFYSVIIYCMFLLSGLEVFSLKTAVKVLLPVTKNQWWFASTYFVMYLIHPYVNRLLHSFTHEEYKKFLLSVMLYWCIIPALTNSDFGANQTINFMCLYSLAGYVRFYPDDFKRKYIFYGLMFTGIFAVIVKKPMYLIGMMKPFTLLASLWLLISFSNLNIPHSKVINMIASATFGVYLIHDNNFVRPFIWKQLFRVASFQESQYLIPYSLAVVLIVYISCTVLESIRSKIFRTLTRGYLS